MGRDGVEKWLWIGYLRRWELSIKFNFNASSTVCNTRKALTVSWVCRYAPRVHAVHYWCCVSRCPTLSSAVGSFPRGYGSLPGAPSSPSPSGSFPSPVRPLRPPTCTRRRALASAPTWSRCLRPSGSAPPPHSTQRTGPPTADRSLVRTKLHYTDTGYGHVVQHHQSKQAHNNSTTCCTTDSPQTDKNLPHLNILTCRDVGLWHCNVANFCPLVVTLLYNKL